jgi:hypothetical protein
MEKDIVTVNDNLLTKLKGKIEVPFGRMLGNFRK